MGRYIEASFYAGSVTIVPLSKRQASNVNTKCRSIKWKHHSLTFDLTLANLSTSSYHRMVKLAWKTFQASLKIFKIFQTLVENIQNISNTLRRSWKFSQTLNETTHWCMPNTSWIRYFRACMQKSQLLWVTIYLDPCYRSQKQDDTEGGGDDMRIKTS